MKICSTFWRVSFLQSVFDQVWKILFFQRRKNLDLNKSRSCLTWSPHNTFSFLGIKQIWTHNPLMIIPNCNADTCQMNKDTQYRTDLINLKESTCWLIKKMQAYTCSIVHNSQWLEITCEKPKWCWNSSSLSSPKDITLAIHIQTRVDDDGLCPLKPAFDHEWTSENRNFIYNSLPVKLKP